MGYKNLDFYRLSGDNNAGGMGTILFVARDRKALLKFPGATSDLLKLN